MMEALQGDPGNPGPQTLFFNRLGTRKGLGFRV